jgi:hypothetical protein
MKLIACAFCSFVFEPWPWTGYDGRGCKVDKLSKAEWIVTQCHEHNCVCCPMCFMCQATAPMPELITIARLRRGMHELRDRANPLTY